jgi:hypothetical protein
MDVDPRAHVISQATGGRRSASRAADENRVAPRPAVVNRARVTACEEVTDVRAK